jgi:hypothetical protein
MFYFGCNFVKFFVELPTFDCKICLFSFKITPFYYPKTKFKHTLNKNCVSSTLHKIILKGLNMNYGRFLSFVMNVQATQLLAIFLQNKCKNGDKRYQCKNGIHPKTVIKITLTLALCNSFSELCYK